jgi:selenium metabolism protein YedF
MSVNVDARGLDCPQPVIATKKALESIVEGIVTVIVDNAVAKENVLKFAVANGCGVSVEEQDGHFYLRITKGTGAAPSQTTPQPATEQGRSLVYLMKQDTLGHGSTELGAVLIKAFFFSLLETQPLPATLLFLNSGVRLTVEGSPVLEHLQQLEKQGVAVFACGTCLDYYQLKDKLAVGTVTNMYTILEKMSQAAKVITI